MSKFRNFELEILFSIVTYNITSPSLSLSKDVNPDNVTRLHEFIDELCRNIHAPVLVPPSSPVQFNKMTNSLTNSLTNPQQAKQPAVAIGTKATLEIATCGSGPGVSYGAMHAPQTVGTMGNFALSIFDPTHSRSDCNTRSKSNACHTW
jgi:hypothetical protein